MDIHSSLKDTDRLYKNYASRLEKLGINTFYDLLYHFPFRYEDYSLISSINNVQPGEKVTIQGTIIEITNTYTKHGKTLQKAKIRDETGTINVIWFNQPYLTRVLKSGDRISLSGVVDTFANKISLQSPEYEVLLPATTLIHTGRLVPVYPETNRVSSKWLRRQIYKTLQLYKQNILEYIPDSIKDYNQLISIQTAIEQIHFPDSIENAKKARERLSFDEIFLLQLHALQRRAQWNKNLIGYQFSAQAHKISLDNLLHSLPFSLTCAQENALKDIFKDLSSIKPMNRLLEGDVGSGKTVVAAIAMYLAHLNGFQSVLMAPTEILTQQHYNTIVNLLEPFGVKIALITGNRKIKTADQKLQDKTSFITPNSFNILIGTHAVLSKNIEFKNLGLVVIDEQQRFGVEQRAIIRQKGKNPHVLTMTATPIPRTVALTMYGDLDLSYLNEMPKGRIVIKTWLVPQEKRDAAYTWIEKEIKQTDSQAFIICPFIEESESMQTVKAATKEFERLKIEVFPNLKLGLLHGRLKIKEKEKILADFKNKKLDMLIATPIVEVGIDIPNATIMVIEAAQRFGLSQLHQLRGRVGRGEKQSYCLLFTESTSDQSLQRLKAMETMQIGAELAEYDLKLRGPGNLYGTLQHGAPRLKIANFSDTALITKARREAKKLFPNLSQYPQLTEKIQSISSEEIVPD